MVIECSKVPDQMTIQKLNIESTAALSVCMTCPDPVPSTRRGRLAIYLSFSQISKKYKISISHAYKIVKRIAWKIIDEEDGNGKS